MAKVDEIWDRLSVMEGTMMGCFGFSRSHLCSTIPIMLLEIFLFDVSFVFP